MKNFRLANIIDAIFINLLIFLIFFAWFKFFNKDLIISLILSLIVLAIYNTVRFFFISKKKNKVKINKNLEKDIEMYMYSLLSNTNEENLEFFYDIFKSFKPIINKENNVLTYKKEDKTYVVCPMFNNKNLNIEDSLKKISYAKQNKASVILLMCVSCQQKEKLFLKQICDIDVKIYEKKDIYLNLFKQANLYPLIKFNIKENKKLKFKQLLDISFNKNQAKGYFLSGIFIFFCSFIVKYNIYYVFMSSILFFFTLLCRIKKDNNSIKKDFILD